MNNSEFQISEFQISGRRTAGRAAYVVICCMYHMIKSLRYKEQSVHFVFEYTEVIPYV